MAAAAGSLGVPLGTIRAAKEAGADGFLSAGRVDTQKLLAWLLTRGEQFTPGLSLEEARAKLTLAKVRELDRQEVAAGGEHVPILRAVQCVGKALDFGKKCVTGRLENLEFMIGLQAKDEAARAEILRLLEEDGRTLRIVWGHVCTQIEGDLRAATAQGK